MADGAKSVEELTFKESLTEVEGIVRGLESNQIEFEESIESYERGVKLIADLQHRLDGAQQKITVLMGELEEDEGDGIDTKLS